MPIVDNCDTKADTTSAGFLVDDSHHASFPKASPVICRRYDWSLSKAVPAL